MGPVTCPSCGESVADGTAICPSCDAVIDAAAFDDAPAAEPAPKPKPASKPAAPARVPDPRKAAKPAAAPAAAPNVSAGIRRRRRKTVDVDYSPDRVLGDTWDAVQSLLPFDRLAVLSAAGMGLALLLPWRTTQLDGEMIGMFGGGWPVLLFIAVAGAALWLRTSDDLRGLRPDQLAGAQILSAALSLGFCVWYFDQAIDNHPYKSMLGVTHLHTSSPELGVVVCAAASIALGIGSIWALMVELGSAG